MDFASSTTRRLSMLAIALLMVMYVGAIPFSIVHMDLARDMGIAHTIVTGEALPLQGPVFASAAHLGPVWYYLLAMLLWLTHSWLGTMLAIGAIASLKFPLAYMLGSRLIDGTFGLLWALMLTLPGWNTFESIYLLHTSLVAACTLAFLLLVLSYHKRGQTVTLAALALAYAIALHAHPSTYGLAFIAIPVLVERWSRDGRHVRPLAWAAIAFLLPFLPFLMHEAWTGFRDFGGVATYASSGVALNRIVDWPRLVAGMAMTGPRLVNDDLVGGGPWLSRLLSAGYLAVVIVALGGIVMVIRNREHRTLAGIAFASLAVLSLTVVVVRDVTPYYMAFVLLALGSGLLALGIRAVLLNANGAKAGMAALVAVVSLVLIAEVGSARTLANGSYRFSFWPLFDIKMPYAPGVPLPFVPAYAMATSGDILCESRKVVAHGAYAFHLLHDYGIEARLSCDRVTVVHIGGSEANVGEHWVGLSRDLLRRLDVSPTRIAGPLGLLSPDRVVHPHAGRLVSDPSVYPATTGAYDPPQRFTVEFEALGSESVVVSNMYFAFTPNPRIVATANGVDQSPFAFDAISTAYVCGSCLAVDTVRWNLAIEAAAPDRVDIVTVRMRAPARQ